MQEPMEINGVKIQDKKIVSIDLTHYQTGNAYLEKRYDFIKNLEWPATENGPGVPKGLAIITGENGNGKTLLLEFLNEVLFKNPHSHENSLNGIYIGPEKKPELSGDQGLHEKVSNFIQQLSNSNLYAIEFIADTKRVSTPTYQLPISMDNKIRERIRNKLREWYKQDFTGVDDKEIINDAVAIALKLRMYIDERLYQSDSIMSIFKAVRRSYLQRRAAIARLDFTTLKDHFSEDWTKFDKSWTEQDGITGSRKKRSAFRAHIIQRHWGKDPLDRINDELRGHFPYEAYLADVERGQNNPDADIKFRNPKSKKDINPDHFSSGEKMILRILSWKCKTFFTKPGKQDATHIILLDEVDKHFDPKRLKQFYDAIKTMLVEQGVQVIMATHRPDMIALAQNDEIFALRKKGGNVSIEKCNKLLALARLSRNLSSFFGQQTKIFTEGFEDADFYNAVYGVAKNFSYKLREQLKQLGTAAANPLQKALRYLSLRYQMHFYSSTFQTGLSGDSTNVARIVTRTSNHVLQDSKASPDHQQPASTPLYNANLFKEFQVDGTFGLIDLDFYYKSLSEEDRQRLLPTGQAQHPEGESRDHAKIPHEVWQDRIVVLNRHSLENFRFDPIFLCSLFRSDEEIKGFFAHKPLVAAMSQVRNSLDSARKSNNFSDLSAHLLALYKQIYAACIAFKETEYTIEKFKAIMAKTMIEKIKKTPKLSGKYAHAKLDVAATITECVQSLPDDYLIKAADEVIKEDIVTADTTQSFGERKVPGSGKTLKDFLKSRRTSIKDIGNEVKKMVDAGHLPGKPFKKTLREVYAEIQRQLNADDAAIQQDCMQDAYHYIDTSGQARVIQLDYPRLLKLIKGHDLEDALISGEKKSAFKDWMKNRIEAMANGVHSCSLFLPHDLVDRLLTLNGRVKTQIVSKADPEKLRRRSEEINAERGYYFPKHANQTIEIFGSEEERTARFGGGADAPIR